VVVQAVRFPISSAAAGEKGALGVLHSAFSQWG
jgi:hypothetical protein